MQPSTITRAPASTSGCDVAPHGEARHLALESSPPRRAARAAAPPVATTSARVVSRPIARGYAPEAIVPSVPSTPIFGSRPLAPRRARRARERGPRARLDHAEHRQVELDAQHVERDGAHRVAGDDERLHAALGEHARAAARVAHDRLGRARAVRDARRVAEVDDALVRERVAERAHHRRARRDPSRRRRAARRAVATSGLTPPRSARCRGAPRKNGLLRTVVERAQDARPRAQACVMMQTGTASPARTARPSCTICSMLTPSAPSAEAMLPITPG